MASNLKQEEEIQEKDEAIIIGKSAQDGVNMAVANAGGEGFGYGQYLQVILIPTLISIIYKLNTYLHSYKILQSVLLIIAIFERH